MWTVESILDANHPHAELEHLGAHLSRDVKESIIQTGDTTDITYTYIHTWTLPDTSDIEATFSRERLHHKVFKLFRPELQVKDSIFDDHVYISTSTPEPLQQLLQHERLQAAILYFIMRGARITLTHNTLALRGPDAGEKEPHPDPHEEAALIASLMLAQRSL